MTTTTFEHVPRLQSAPSGVGSCGTPIPAASALAPIPRFSNYALDLATYTIWRIVPSRRGRFAGRVFALLPQNQFDCLRPQSTLVRDDKKTCRVPTAEVIRAVTGETSTRFGEATPYPDGALHYVFEEPMKKPAESPMPETGSVDSLT